MIKELILAVILWRKRKDYTRYKADYYFVSVTMKLRWHHIWIACLLLLALNAIFVRPHKSSALLLDCSTASNIVVPVQECQALVDLYDSTNGPNWDVSTNWDTDTNVCNWYGVTCLSNRVRTLDLNTNNLWGTLPVSMSGLTQITHLNLSNNNIMGILPSEWSSLTSMLNFQIWNNDLTGSLPSSWSGWTIVNTFEVEGNNLIGTLPSSWSTWRAIINFHVSYNNLTGTFPSSWSLWTGAGVMNMAFSNNFFHGAIPASWTNLTNLANTVGLSLNYNCLDVPQPEPPATFVDTKAWTGWKLTQTCTGRAPRTDLLINKSVDNANRYIGAYVTYTLSYLNKNNAVTGANIVDTLPSGVNYISASPAPSSVVGSTLTWSLGTLAEQASGTIVITGQVAMSVDSGTILSNEALISGFADDYNLGNNLDTADILIFGATGVSSDLAMTKTVNTSTPTTGDNIQFRLVYTNSGSDNVTGVVITDTLPTGITYVSASPAPSSVVGSTLTWDIAGTVTANSSGVIIITWSINDNVASGTVITNYAYVTGTLEDIATWNNTGNVSFLVFGVPPTVSDLVISKSVNSLYAASGDTIIYTLTYSNSGSQDVTGVTITDVFPTGWAYIYMQPTATSVTGSTYTWNIGSIPAGSSGTIVLSGLVSNVFSSGTVISNNATISGQLIDLDSTNNSGTANFTIFDFIPTSDIIITKAVDNATPTTGSIITYTLTFSNSGSETVYNVLVSDILPSGVTYVSASSSATVSGSTVSWFLGGLAPNSVGSVTITGQIDADVASGTSIVNSAQITGVLIESDNTNNTGSVTITVLGVTPDVVVESGGGWGGGGGYGWGGGYDYTPPPSNNLLGSAPILDEIDDGCIYQDGDFSKFKTTFIDVQDTIYKSAIDTMLDHCLVQWYKNKWQTFGVNNNLKRWEAYKVFARLAGLGFNEQLHPKHRADMYRYAGENIKLWASTSFGPHPMNWSITLADVYTISNNLLKYYRKPLLEYNSKLKYNDPITRGKFALWIQDLIIHLRK